MVLLFSMNFWYLCLLKLLAGAGVPVDTQVYHKRKVSHAINKNNSCYLGLHAMVARFKEYNNHGWVEIPQNLIQPSLARADTSGGCARRAPLHAGHAFLLVFLLNIWVLTIITIGRSLVYISFLSISCIFLI